ncbi:GntR family transcriptional regulator [Paraburkholderia tropica]|uniref:FadR/GntR family transcriptional regulator n=1 Tax=Paraburkholderia TaxID=1822464 RepID=UPI001CB30392|nr:MULTISPECIES: FadR/GntR family transcriptional regulator [Paraburkholderia]CAG9193043.1 GntR family transcriptional regulator [Paraburkholderia tropica]
MSISPLTDLAYQGILAFIDRHRLGGDDKLPGENTMAELLGVSRPVVRQALAQLRSEGWIVSRKGSGNYVGRPQLRSMPFGPIENVEEVRAFLEFRCVIEGECAAWAATHAQPDLLREISARRRLLEVAIHRGTESIEEDIAFHEAIAQASGNKFYGMTMAAIRDHRRIATRMIRELSNQPRLRRVRDIRDEHLRIDEAIARGDSDGARQAMVEHIRSGIARLFG